MVNADTVAQICHEANRIYCNSIDDGSIPTWETAPEWQRTSMITGVTFKRYNPDATPQSMHDNWMKTKKNEGWKYGPVKDVEKKEHPCMVPYDELPEAQKVKDLLFSAIVTALSQGEKNGD